FFLSNGIRNVLLKLFNSRWNAVDKALCFVSRRLLISGKLSLINSFESNRLFVNLCFNFYAWRNNFGSEVWFNSKVCASVAGLLAKAVAKSIIKRCFTGLIISLNQRGFRRELNIHLLKSLEIIQRD